MQLNDSYLWQPARVNTFVLPVIEIEQIVVELQYVASKNTITPLVRSQLQQEIANWLSILTKYRSYNDDLKNNAKLFTEMDKQWNNIVNGLANKDAQTFDPNYLNSLSLTSFADAYQTYRSNCDGNSYRGATWTSSNAELCGSFKSTSWMSAAYIIHGMCDSNAASQSQMFKQFCKQSSVDGANIPGGLSGGASSAMESMLGFLYDSEKMLTFSSNAPMSMAWQSTASDSNGYSKSKKVSNGATVGASVYFLLNVFGVLNTFTLGYNGDFSHSTHDSDSSTVEQALDRTITVVLDDADQGDYFAIRIAEDPLYGTPIFHTAGGQSKCPGESGTSRRESNVKIERIVHRCGADRKSYCDELTLQGPDDVAYFGVVITNLSPTEDVVTYSVGLASSFDSYDSNASSYESHCGKPGQRSGLVAEFMETELEDIPFNEQIEVPFTVSKSGLCNAFRGIKVAIVASCEIASSSSRVYQYGVIYDTTTHMTKMVYDAGNVITAAESSATFDVVWADSQRRRLHQDHSDLVNDLQEDLAEMRWMIGTLVCAMCALIVVLLLAFGVWMFASVKLENAAYLGK